MGAFISKLIFVMIVCLANTSVATEVFVSFPAQDSIAHTKTIAVADNAVTAGMQWQILPGEDILQIARLMFPQDSAARHKLIRAMIGANPGHFPEGAYRSLPAGTIIRIPDLRTIDAYSRLSIKQQKPSKINHLARSKSTAIPEAVESNLNSHDLIAQLFTKLQQLAENDSREFSMLIKRIESLELQFAEINAQYSLKIQESHQQPIDRPSAIQEPSIQNPENPVIPDETIETAAENNPISFIIGIAGILLTVLIAIIIMWSYRKIQRKFPESTHAPDELPLPPDITDHHDASVSNQNNKKLDVTGSLANTGSQVASDAELLVKQGNPEAAVQFLQKQLSIHRFDVPGWILLFELLYASGSKADFRKNARRFRRLGEFPDLWAQIQNLGHRLEPDESLYFDEQKRKEKFFPDSSDFD